METIIAVSTVFTISIIESGIIINKKIKGEI